MEYLYGLDGNQYRDCFSGILVTSRLPEPAHRTGERFAEGLGAPAIEPGLTGKVRGRDVFLGMELVPNHETREPATDEAFALIERRRENGLLVGKSGPCGNVIRIGPPLTISDDHVARALETLGDAFRLVKQVV